MKKLKPVNEITGTFQALVKTLLTVDGKNIAVPIDKLPGVQSLEAKEGDLVWVQYNDRGFLMDMNVKERCNVEAKPKPKQEEKKETAVQAAAKIPKEVSDIIDQGQYKEVQKFMVDPVYKDNIILLQTCYKEGCQTVRELMLIPEDILNETELERLHTAAVKQAIVDALALKKAAGEMR